ncbi:hypothetical protein RFN29_01765 [Mesorhizobium sp. VK22B]|uniref:Uncharacterized protein n=1 Tax=Mesorhizobium captivum TaxID=3072319 RepID=A0ABU4YUD6_9HYPH|nr:MULTISPECIES: hypothetical protein [unclassified Mesorhizobium]MDX8490296.1 hypothetical protein [Mesorhizobium sp. VK22B]MDX8509653.1 hypothetical protein [Mesorhizobium sp. VK22E]
MKSSIGCLPLYQVACIIAMVNIVLSLGLFGLYRLAAGRLGP